MMYLYRMLETQDPSLPRFLSELSESEYAKLSIQGDCTLSAKGLTKENPLRVFDKTTLDDENIRFVYEKNGYEVDLILSKDRFFNMLREGEVYVGEYFCDCIEKALTLLEKKERITKTDIRDAIILTMQILNFDSFLNYFLRA